MGRRSGFETIARIFVAFLQQQTWRQTDLARECELSTKALRARLLDLVGAGVPLQREKEHPHVYWSVPHSWFPSGTALAAADVSLVVRLVARLPRSREREKVLGQLLGGLPAAGQHEANRQEEQSKSGVLATLEDCSAQNVAGRIDYFSASRGDQAVRHVSIHRVLYGDDVRFLATCHRDGALKLFRLDRVLTARPDPNEPCRPAVDEKVEEHLRASFAGFHGGGSPVPFSFVVRWPEGRWVLKNLPEAMAVDHLSSSARLSGATAGLDVLARFVVGLGDMAQVETDELRDRVLLLAQGSLRSNAAVRKLNGGAVGSKRAAG